MDNTPQRCQWARKGSAEEVAYHDNEWGVPSYDPHHLFEMLLLEGAQAGLSWSTILNKRDGYRRAFDGFDAYRIACYDQQKVSQLLTDPSIVRNRLKIEAAIINARCFVALVDEHPGGFAQYLWEFVGGQPTQNAWTRAEQVPTSTPGSDAMARDLRRRGFKFVGTTICYAFMQAVGMANDHTTDCFRYPQILDFSHARGRVPKAR
nr:DNA-3-methyladenine glycosylase I [Gammaproteobacteria bacterium]